MLLIICIERLLHIGSHFSLRKWFNFPTKLAAPQRWPHFPTKLAAAASFPTKLAAAARIWQHYWRLFWHGLDIGVLSIKGTDSVLEFFFIIEPKALNFGKEIKMWKKNVLIHRIFCMMHSFQVFFKNSKFWCLLKTIHRPQFWRKTEHCKFWIW